MTTLRRSTNSVLLALAVAGGAFLEEGQAYTLNNIEYAAAEVTYLGVYSSGTGAYNADSHKLIQLITDNVSGDLTVPLGRFSSGTLHLSVVSSGSYARGCQTFTVSRHYGEPPVVSHEGGGAWSDPTIELHGHTDSSSSSYYYLYLNYNNTSPSSSHSNRVKINISCNASWEEDIRSVTDIGNSVSYDSQKVDSVIHVVTDRNSGAPSQRVGFLVDYPTAAFHVGEDAVFDQDLDVQGTLSVNGEAVLTTTASNIGFVPYDVTDGNVGSGVYGELVTASGTFGGGSVSGHTGNTGISETFVFGMSHADADSGGGVQSSFAVGASSLNAGENGQISHSVALGQSYVQIGTLATVSHAFAAGNSVVEASHGVAMGTGSVSSPFGVAIGEAVLSDQANLTVFGRYNAAGQAGDLMVIGNGTGAGAESNAFVVRDNGDLEISGEAILKVPARGGISMGAYGGGN